MAFTAFVSDVFSRRIVGWRTAAFHGDYNELDARWTGTNHVVHVAWADNRDVSPCDTDQAPGPASG